MYRKKVFYKIQNLLKILISSICRCSSFLKKGYSMLVYDFKYPTLAEITYYHYLLNKQHGGPLKDHEFHCINLDKIEHSRRINPLMPHYINTLAKAGETADAIVSALKKGEKGSGGGADQFFTQSAIN